MSQQYNLALGQERLREVIGAKKEQPMIGNRVTMDWRAAQLAMVDKIKHEGVVAALIQLQIQMLRGRIPSFYSFFIMQKSTNESDTLELVEKQINLIRSGKSKYHSIKAYIKMREELLEKLRRGGNGQGKSLFQDIDDIRFLNFEIVGLVRKLKEEWRVEGALQPSFYQGGVNYLLKINNDNADLINAANFKKIKFISPPNPFFLSQDGNLSGMSAKQKQQIGQCIELIGRQRVSELRISIQSSGLASKPQNLIKKARSSNKMQARKEIVENSFIKDARNEMLISKQEEIKKIYTINRSLESTKNRASFEKMSNLNIRKISKEKEEKILQSKQDKKYENSYAQMDRFMKVKESSIIQNKLNPSKNRYSPAIHPNFSKISSTNNLRNQIDKVVKQISKPSSPKKREVKEIKPKIKMVQQKQVIIHQEPIRSGVTNTNSSMFTQVSRSLTRKNSTFYKKIIPIAEEAQETPVRPATSSMRKKSISQSNFYPIKHLKYEKQRASQRQKSLQNAHESTIKNLKRQQQLEVRNLNSQLKNLTIINIYKGRANKKKQKARMNSQPRAEEESGYQQRNRFSSFVAESNQRNSISHIQTSKLSSQYEKVRGFTDRQFSKLSVQLEKKMTKNKIHEEQLRQKQQQRLLAQKQLQMKSLMISQLQKKIKKMQSLKSANLRKEQLIKNHSKQFQKSKKVKQIQQKILQDKIKSQQSKFIQNQQMQLRLREEQAKLELKKNIKNLEAESIKQRKQYEKRIHQEEKKMKEIEKMINFEKKKQKQVEKQLEQKKLKEALLRKMMQEKESQKEKIIETEKQLEKMVQNEIKYREKLQLQALEQIQKEKKKMQAFYEEMVRKNKQLQQQNEKKLKELQQFDNKKAKEQQQLRIAEQLFQKRIAQQDKQKLQQQQQQRQVIVDENIDSLKLKLKQQLLQEMLKKQQEQDEQQKLQQQRRQQRLKRIEREVSQALKAQQDTLQKQNAQFLKRIQEMREKVLMPSTHEHDKSSTQEYNSIVNNIQIKSEHERLERIPSTMELQSKESELVNKQVENDFKKVEEIKNERLLKINSAELLFQSSPQKTLKQEEKVNDVSQKRNSQFSIFAQEPSKEIKKDSTKIRQSPQQQNSKLQEIVLAPSFSVQLSKQIEKQKKQIQISEKKKDIADLNDEKPQVQQGFLKQQKPKGQTQDLLQKYKNLTIYLKKTRQVLIQQKNISNFIDTFISQLQRTIRQMLPYSKFDLQRIFSSKKVDIFENNTIGWLQQKDKYNLIGNLDCIETLLKRYGAIQIHQVFIFEKSNPYQKQFLAKKMKIFEKIGFIFQKKLEDSQKFMIRFVIKLPKQIAGEAKSIKPKIVSKISLQHYQQICKQSLNHKVQFSFSYMISRLLRQNLDKSKLSQIAQSSDNFLSIIHDQIQLGAIRQQFRHINIDEVSDSLMEVQMRLPFKYFRSHQKGFFMISCKQHQYDGNHYYTAELQPHLNVVIHEVKSSNNPLDHVLNNTIKAINKSDKVGNIDVCLPLWNYNKIQVMQSQGLYYSHRQKIIGDYALGSIISTFLHKHQYANIKTPFVLAYCLTDDDKRLIRQISGHVITSDLLVNQHLK